MQELYGTIGVIALVLMYALVVLKDHENGD